MIVMQFYLSFRWIATGTGRVSTARFRCGPACYFKAEQTGIRWAGSTRDVKLWKQFKSA